MACCSECTLTRPLDGNGRCATCAQEYQRLQGECAVTEDMFDNDEAPVLYGFGCAPTPVPAKFRHWRCKCGIERTITPAVHNVTCNRCFQNMNPIGRAEIPGVA